MSAKKSASKQVVSALPEDLQDDDEFEEFEDDWSKAEEEASDKVAWVDDWDDEKVDDDFSSQLRAELAKQATMDTSS
eukprot:CAMPEP_0177657144 /NCGR_PEP_ID=MMETSP0447-20121125/16010_1 /TAXON_ID=0 /ORGANISM="Stygamoeba regulata, Strain BSH-02190019" /LENGTH=76 /DNA_ID=CAMNT_0019161443 /DNA_START=35 /DNA_END=265 /DNA_ORIENTATION=-